MNYLNRLLLQIRTKLFLNLNFLMVIYVYLNIDILYIVLLPENNFN